MEVGHGQCVAEPGLYLNKHAKKARLYLSLGMHE
jgi:hypothetical protein